ncbi:MAG: hypothetical protein ACR2QX_08160 [Woeseiaceae bacterium]
MKKNTMAIFATACLSVLMMLPASAAPVLFGDNGHYYEVIAADGISWSDAKTAAEGQMFPDPFGGPDIQGHLAIITTAAEDDFIEGLRSQADLGRPQVWVGAEQAPGNAPGDGWSWITGESPFVFTNWQSGEPNDFNGIDEVYLGVGLGNVPGWNDEHSLGNIGGYVVEFDVNAVVFEDEDLDECLESTGEGCSTAPNGSQIIMIPDSAVQDPDASLRVTTFRLTDDPSRCGLAPLELFSGDLIISPNHCATPETNYEFLVVHTESEGIVLQEGTVEIVQNAKAALPDFPYTCDQPIPGGVSANDQEIVIYQRTDKEDMREYGETWGPFMDVGDEAGASSDITDGCSSSRGRRAENSYSVIGMVQRFDPGSELENDPDLNFLRWTELTRFKLVLLNEAIDASKPALGRVAFWLVNRQAEKALRRFDQASYRRAIIRLDVLLWLVEYVVTYDTLATDNNDQGEAIERAASTRYIIAEKIKPFGAGM